MLVHIIKEKNEDAINNLVEVIKSASIELCIFIGGMKRTLKDVTKCLNNSQGSLVLLTQN